MIVDFTDQLDTTEISRTIYSARLDSPAEVAEAYHQVDNASYRMREQGFIPDRPWRINGAYHHSLDQLSLHLRFLP